MVLPRKGFLRTHKVGFDESILICVRRAVFFAECGSLPFVASHPLASIGHLKGRDLCVEKWKRHAKINNK